MNLEKQRQNVSILLDLIKHNPELPIVPMVSTGCIFDDSHGYWMAEWSKAELTKYWCSDERIYQYYEDFDDLVDMWVDNNYGEEKYSRLSEGELIELAENIVNNYEWVDAIVVYIESV